MLLAVVLFGSGVDAHGAQVCWMVQIGHYEFAHETPKGMREVSDPGCQMIPHGLGARVVCGCYASEALALKALPEWQQRFYNTEVISPTTAYANSTSVQPQSYYPVLPIKPPATGAERAAKLRQRPDEKLPDTEFSTTLFERPLTIGGELSGEVEEQRDFALGSEEQAQRQFDAALELELFYGYSTQSALFLEASAHIRRKEDRISGQREQDSYWHRGESWLFSGGWFNDRVGVQLGRQNFIDTREWWWDANLDALRLHYDSANSHAEIAIAQELAPVRSDEAHIDPEEDGLTRLFASYTTRDGEHGERSIFMLVQQDDSATPAPGSRTPRPRRDRSDLDAVWLGWRHQDRQSLGAAGRLYHWLDAALLWGEERRIDYDSIDSKTAEVAGVSRHHLRGGALDLGASWQTRLPGRLTLSVGYALGSGDEDPDDENDTTFRQTGLQDNNDKFRGVNSFRYYGELLDPELANLTITTLALGFHLGTASSVELIHHTYTQLEASTELADNPLDVDPVGSDRALGSEVDLVIGVEAWRHTELELVAARFSAGAAFGAAEGERATLWRVELSHRF